MFSERRVNMTTFIRIFFVVLLLIPVGIYFFKLVENYTDEALESQGKKNGTSKALDAPKNANVSKAEASANKRGNKNKKNKGKGISNASSSTKVDVNKLSPEDREAYERILEERKRKSGSSGKARRK